LSGKRLSGKVTVRETTAHPFELAVIRQAVIHGLAINLTLRSTCHLLLGVGVSVNLLTG